MNRLIKSALLAATLLTPGVVLAQDSDAETDDGATTIGTEIIVTARKREENLQDVPVAVSVFGEQLIDDANIAGLSEISDFTPGFQLQSAFGRNADRPVIRGASNILIAEGKVGFFVDGVPFVGAATALDLENFSRIEVIKGPQSAVFGRGTLSGAVNYVSKRAPDELTVEFEATAATHDDYEAFVRVSGPLAEGLSGFISGKYSSFGGDYTNSVTGNRLGQESTTIAAGLNYEADDFEASIIYLRTEDDDDHYAIALQDASFNNVFTAGSRGYFQGEVELRGPIGLNTDELINPGLERKADRFIATATADLGDSGFTATALFGYSSITERVGTDQSFDDQNALFFSAFVCGNFIADCAFGVSAFNTDNETKREAISTELRFASPQDRPIRVEVGGFFFDDETRGTTYGRKQTEFGFGSVAETDAVNNLAAFGSIEFDVTDRLTIGGELRVARDEIRTRPGADYRLGDLFTGVADPDRIIAGSGALRKAVFNSVLPRITVDYEVSPDLLIYAKYSEGNSPGGFNAVDAPRTTFDEERLKNYEVGFKSSLLPGLIFNVAGFFNEYSDQVLTSNFTTSTGGVNSFSDNVGDTEIWGLEADASWQVNDFLTLSATYAFIDAEIVRGLNGDQGALLGGTAGTGTAPDPDNPGATVVTTNGCSNPAATLDAGQLLGDGTLTTGPTPCSTFADISGQRAPLVSKHQGTFSTALDIPLGDSDWSVFARGDLIYRSSFFAQIHNLAETGDSTKVNFAAGVQNGDVTVRLWVKNAFQDETPRGILRYLDFSAPRINGERPRAFAITPPERRQFGITVAGTF